MILFMACSKTSKGSLPVFSRTNLKGIITHTLRDTLFPVVHHLVDQLGHHGVARKSDRVTRRAWGFLHAST